MRLRWSQRAQNDLVEIAFVRSYRIIYRIEDHQTIVLTVLEGHRLLRAGMLDEP